ncbi:MAG: HD domain-containing protein, partial [Candidatus Parvarchaeum sp.]
MTKEKELDSILAFMLRADKLKEVDRTGWTIAKVDMHENVGDHSYSTALLAFLFAKEMGLDANKCAVMALIHDINEVITGDTATRYDKSMQTLQPDEKKHLERQNELEMISSLVGSGRESLEAMLSELDAKVTPEAKMVKQVDK